MNRGASTMKRTGFATAQRREDAGTKPKRSTMKTKQRAVSAAEKAMWSRLAGLGCIACMIDHVHQPVVSIHHVDGRTKPDCHKLVLPLCAGHHQAGTGEDKSLIAVHPDKARFEARYGTQAELMARCAALLEVLK